MTKNNLVKKLGKRFLPYLLAGSLAVTALFNYRCVDEFVEPEPEKPVAMLIANPTEGDAPLEVSFDGSLSYARAPKSYLEKYLWDFDGDGNTDATTSGTSGAWVDQVYERGGEYDPSLIVVDNQGRKSNKAKLLEKIVVSEEEIISLGRIAFMNQNRDDPYRYEDDIYSGDIVIRDNNIELVDLKRLTTDPEYDSEPAWSPDGEEIAFTTNREDVNGDGIRDIAIYIMNADGSNPRGLTYKIQLAMSPYWCADNKIIFTFVNYGSMGVASINPDGTNYTELFSESGGPTTPWAYPSCSPDGSKIAFGAIKDGNWEIYTMSADGNNLERITNNPAVDLLPDWSPDGNEILFKSDRSGSTDIYRMNTDGNNIRRITDDPGIETDPKFSPEGLYILFTHDDIGFFNPQIYLMNSDGTGNWTQLTFDGANRFPAWRPKREDQNFN